MAIYKSRLNPPPAIPPKTFSVDKVVKAKGMDQDPMGEAEMCESLEKRYRYLTTLTSGMEMGTDGASAMQTNLESLADEVNKVNGNLEDTLKMLWSPLPPPEMLNQQQKETPKMVLLYDDTSEDAADKSYCLTP